MLRLRIACHDFMEVVTVIANRASCSTDPTGALCAGNARSLADAVLLSAGLLEFRVLQ